MTFVFPMLLGGLALAGIPVLLHLIMRQKPRTLPFPAFRFLVQKHRSNLRKLQLRHLVLLALRVLLIAALCLALARPKLFHETFNLSSERPVAAILVFDTSPSMGYETTDQVSRLDEAKKRGLQLLDQFPDGSRFLVLDSADAIVSDRADWMTSAAEVRKRIAALKVRPDNAAPTRAIEQALRQFQALAQSTDDDRSAGLARLLCVFSDRTAASWPGEKLPALIERLDDLPATLEGLQQLRATTAPLLGLLEKLRTELPPPAGTDYPDQTLREAVQTLSERAATLQPDDLRDAALQAQLGKARAAARDLTRSLNKASEQTPFDADSFGGKLLKTLGDVQRELAGVQVLYFDVGVEQPSDIAILAADFPRQADGQVQQLFAGDEKVILGVVVQALGKNVSTAVECKIGTETLRKDVDLPAGVRVTVPFELDLQKLKLAAGSHTLEVRLVSKDSLASNNERFATLAIREPKRVLVLADNASKAERFAFALTVVGYASEVKTPADLATLDLGKYQAVYLFGLADPSDAVWNAVAAYVQKGGGVGIIPGGNEMKPAAYATAAAKSVMPGEWKAVVTRDDKDAVTWNLDAAGIFQHSILKPFRLWRENLDIDFIANPRRAQGYWLVEPTPKLSTVLVSYADKGDPPALVERLGSPGKVVLLTTPLDDRVPRWNNYSESITSFYLALTKLVTTYLTGEDRGVQLNFTLGVEEARMATPLTPRFVGFTLRGRDLLENIAADGKESELRIKEASTPGNYEVKGVVAAGQDGPTIARFSVNLPAEEADLTRTPLASVESILGAGSVVEAERDASIRDLLAGHWNEPLELFPLLLVVLLFVLALENLLANKFYRREG